MKDHITKINGKAFAMRAKLSSVLTNKCTPRKIKTKIYELFIRPTILYASPAWGGLLKRETVKRLETNERKCIRSIFRIKKRTRNTYVYKLTGILPIKEIIKKDHQNYFRKIDPSTIGVIKELALPKSRERDKYKRPENMIL